MPQIQRLYLTLIFLKRNNDVFEDEIKGFQEEYGEIKIAEEIERNDHSLGNSFGTEWGF